MMQHWAKTQERGNYWGIIFVLRAYKYGGRWIMRFMLMPIIFYFFLTSKKARRASKNYLTRLHIFSGDASPFTSAPTSLNSLRHFWQFGLSVVEKTDAWIGKVNKRGIKNCGSIHFTDLENSSRGGILIGSHLGNIEVARAVANQTYKKRMNILVFTQHAQSFNRALQELNGNVAIDLIQVTEIDMALTIMLRERVDQGELVVIVGDRVSVTRPEQSVRHHFLGMPADFAIGPWVLASILECPVYFFFFLRSPHQANYHLYLDLATEQLRLPRRNRHQLLQRVLGQYVAQLEYLCRLYPYQWFNFYNFWQQHKDS
ncbi:acetyltransferase [Pseudidiomarina salinarum]|uniref:Acetyltransferase n=1 Tax=Pseudidiomarina salinarum TaxID=435908 RepID=A0A094IT70_9GAMM|nr:acetyltransferase [Pseudidiomarina salinarum]KFZ30855.1 acetyltransferase [Pseudidiomarina salinarum]